MHAIFRGHPVGRAIAGREASKPVRAVDSDRLTELRRDTSKDARELARSPLRGRFASVGESTARTVVWQGRTPPAKSQALHLVFVDLVTPSTQQSDEGPAGIRSGQAE